MLMSSPLPPLGKLTRIDARTVWRHEALDFTSWVKPNIDILSKALGMELERPEAEEPVGDCSRDAVAQDVVRTRPPLPVPGHQRSRLAMLRVLLALTTCYAATFSLATAQAPMADGEIVAGTCAAPGSTITDLASPALPDGTSSGAAGTRTAATSFSTAPVSLSAMLADPMAIMIGINGEQAVCSDIGGARDASGDLVLGLTSVGSSDAFGIAYLSPNETDADLTDVSLFVVPPTAARTQSSTRVPLPMEVKITEGTISNETVIDIDASTGVPGLPTETPVAEQQQADNGTFGSGGLGLTLDDLHAKYGTGASTILGESIPVGNGRLIVKEHNGVIDALERSFDAGVSFNDAEAIGLLLAPPDAELLQTYLTEVGSTVDLFYSPSLESRFPPTFNIGDEEYSTWVNGEPGQFFIGYGGYNPAVGNNEVTRMVIGLGNNP
jgi:hypothetical protein